jgi:uncharacterized cupredoxin-like copper-binding protein
MEVYGGEAFPAANPFAVRRRSTRRIAARLAGLGFVLASIGQTHAAGSAEFAVRMTAGEFFFAPREVTALPGKVTFSLRNGGEIEHNFVIETTGGKRVAEIAVIEPGQTLETAATLSAGTYTIYCSLPGHRDAGMVATLSAR